MRLTRLRGRGHAPSVAFLFVGTLLALAGSGRAAATATGSGPAALPNGDNAVGFRSAKPPRPLPARYGFPVEDPALPANPDWSSTPLLLPNGSSVMYLQVRQGGMCAGDAEECPPGSEVQRFAAGGSPAGQFDLPMWTYRLPRNMDASQPVWWHGAITFAEFGDGGDAPPGPLPPVSLVRLSLTGHVLSSMPLPTPPSFGAGTSASLYPGPAGLLVYESVTGAAGGPVGALELLKPDLTVEWARGAAGTLVWPHGPVAIFLKSAKGRLATYQAVSVADGHTLWAAALSDGGLVGVAAGTAVFERTPSWQVQTPLTVTARGARTGRLLWRRSIADVARVPGSQDAVFAAGSLVLCASPGTVHPRSKAAPTCSRYDDATGKASMSVVVPDAPPGSVVEPIASSPGYLLVQVLKAPLKVDLPGQTCRNPQGQGCSPSSTFTEAVPWSGRGEVPVRKGAATWSTTYDLGPRSAVTVTGASSGWAWGNLPVPRESGFRPPANE